ncbi:MAG: spore maturation protein [Candidatus Electryonea clarkiae]|nr:spore maturation protein [Candidatus Electryonea clarkiae]MDP8287061.1 spore maturation protein [Candidatus Electryonea clarkiae]
MSNTFQNILTEMGSWAIPFAIILILTVGFFRKVKVYEAFVEGAKEGFQVGVRIIPYLVAILAAIAVFRASGALDLLTNGLSPFLNLIGYPTEAIPMALVRPLSGSGALGLMSDLVATHGAESFVGRLASVMMGSTETTFYVLAVYLGSIGIRRARHTLAACLIADAAGLTAAFIVCKIVF